MRNIAIGIILIIAGLSGQFVMRGTHNGGWLVLAGVGLIIWGIIDIVAESRAKEKLAREIAEGGGSGTVQDGTAKQIKNGADENASAAVFIYRISVYAGSRNPHIINCDGTLSANLPNGSYALLRVPEGKHEFACSAAMSGIKLDIQSGQRYYIKTGVKSIFKGIFESVPEETAQREMQSLKQIPNDTVNKNYRVTT